MPHAAGSQLHATKTVGAAMPRPRCAGMGPRCLDCGTTAREPGHLEAQTATVERDHV